MDEVKNEFDYDELKKLTEELDEFGKGLQDGTSISSADIVRAIHKHQTPEPILQQIEDDQILDVATARAILSITAEYLRQLCREGVIKSHKLPNGRYRFHGKDIKDYYYNVVSKRRLRERYSTIITDSTTDILYCDVHQAAQYLERTEDYVRNILIKKGAVEAKKVGILWLISVESLQAHKRGESNIKHIADKRALTWQFTIPAELLKEEFPLLEKAMIEGNVTVICKVSSQDQIDMFEELGFTGSRRTTQKTAKVRKFVRD